MITIKNLIEYYYGFNKFTYSKDANRTIIKYDDKVFYLYMISNPDEVIEQYEMTVDSNFFYKFVLNKNNSIISEYGGSFFVLLEDTLIHKNEAFDHLEYSLSINKQIVLRWRELWLSKSDYISYYYSSIIGKYRLIDESVDYYLGILEIAILYLNDYLDYSDVGFIQHKKYDEKNIHNPLNLKIDVKERDFAEYLKYLFFSNEYNNIDLEDLIMKNKDYYNYELIIARLLYPNFYFDLFDKVMLGEACENVLYKVISRSGEYEDYLKKIISIIIKFFEIKKIDWL